MLYLQNHIELHLNDPLEGLDSSLSQAGFTATTSPDTKSSYLFTLPGVLPFRPISIQSETGWANHNHLLKWSGFNMRTECRSGEV